MWVIGRRAGVHAIRATPIGFREGEDKAKRQIVTIFARRRLQRMLNDLGPKLVGGKGTDIVKRLNSKKYVEQALPAEMELALLWAIATLGDIEIEPEWWADGKRPDAVTDALVAGREVVIEIAALSDNAISGEDVMDAIAIQISAIANKGKKGSGEYLYFRFQEEKSYAHGEYTRRRLAPMGYKLTSAQCATIEDWVSSGRSLVERLRLAAPELDVEIEHTAAKQTRFHNLFSTMPPETHSLEANPLFDAMVRKLRQLKNADRGTLRMIFLADVGSSLLNRIGRVGEIDYTRRFVSGREIIAHFVGKYAERVDAVVTFSPLKETSRLGGPDLAGRNPRRWTVGYFGSPALPVAPKALTKLAALLPEPHYEGYQARSLFRQDAFSPENRGQYLGRTIRGRAGMKDMSVEFSARMLLDLLAGRMSEEQFRCNLAGRSESGNIFRHWLDSGLTISGAEMAPRDDDEDDDHILLHFSDDPAARPFRLPSENENSS